MKARNIIFLSVFGLITVIAGLILSWKLLFTHNILHRIIYYC